MATETIIELHLNMGEQRQFQNFPNKSSCNCQMHFCLLPLLYMKPALKLNGAVMMDDVKFFSQIFG
jgi:hypothetical protein